MKSNISFEDFYRNYCKIFINGNLVETPELTDYQMAFAHWLENQTEPITLIPTRNIVHDKSYELWKETEDDLQEN